VRHDTASRATTDRNGDTQQFSNFAQSTDMKFRSTRHGSPEVALSDAIVQGLAPDGGLYVPTEFPRLSPAPGPRSHRDVAREFLAPFFAGDPVLGPELDDIVDTAFDFPLPLLDIEPGTAVLELFHGPSAAFKDFGARFLAQTMPRALAARGERATILVATSGDTGGAVAAAFHGVAGVDVVVLYPRGRVSDRQEHHLTCWDDNVTTYAVAGDFDDTQAIVKAAFNDKDMRAAFSLTSANSINIGRLLPQATYYAWASLEWQARHAGPPPTFVVPTGNVGNALAAVWARTVGYPVGDVVFATNANRTVADFLDSGDWQPRATTPTLANAMDVGNPSNMERIRDQYDDIDAIRGAISAYSVGDDTIREAISRGPERWNQVWCPHTACAAHVRETFVGGPAIIVATAHPAKFETVVEQLVGEEIPVPENLARLLSLPSVILEIEPRPGALAEKLQERATPKR
jgi:threonine synthase